MEINLEATGNWNWLMGMWGDGCRGVWSQRTTTVSGTRSRRRVRVVTSWSSWRRPSTAGWLHEDTASSATTATSAVRATCCSRPTCAAPDDASASSTSPTNRSASVTRVRETSRYFLGPASSASRVRSVPAFRPVPEYHWFTEIRLNFWKQTSRFFHAIVSCFLKSANMFCFVYTSVCKFNRALRFEQLADMQNDQETNRPRWRTTTFLAEAVNIFYE